MGVRGWRTQAAGDGYLMTAGLVSENDPGSKAGGDASLIQGEKVLP